LLDRGAAQGIVSLKGVRQSGARAGNWLSREQARDMLAQPGIETIEGKRDRAILAVLLGCALRRSELAALDCGHIQQRDGRWVFVDLLGKGKRIRAVPIPPFVKVAIDAWTAAAGLSGGPLFQKLAPHDMRRTCAKLCRESGGDLEQIQFLLGHASIQTTERYLGSRQNLKEAVNDRLGLDE
jgi:integrase